MINLYYLYKSLLYFLTVFGKDVTINEIIREYSILSDKCYGKIISQGLGLVLQ